MSYFINNRFYFFIFFLFYINISLFSVTLPDGSEVKAEDIKYYNNKNIKSVKLLDPANIKTPFGKLMFGDVDKKYNLVTFYKNGKIKRLRLAQDIEIDDKVFYDRSLLLFDENGKCQGRLEWDDDINESIIKE